MITRYSGAGNIFFLIDQRHRSFPRDRLPVLWENPEIDGALFVESSTVADARMRVFNRDGSEAQMCGNGLRCFIHFLNELEIVRDVYHVETLAGIQKGWFVDEKDHIGIELTPSHGLKLHLQQGLHFINTGVPHAVHFVDDIETIDVDSLGKSLRFSPHFAPEGANVNFVALRDHNSLAIRTYERGVERETLACGTGACASALLAHTLYQYSSPIQVLVRSGDSLKISFTPDWSRVSLEGPVKKLEVNLQKNIMSAT
jgi:diaminopimelate epimerase